MLDSQLLSPLNQWRIQTGFYSFRGKKTLQDMYNANKYKDNYKKLFREVGMAVPKRNGTRVGWWLLM